MIRVLAAALLLSSVAGHAITSQEAPARGPVRPVVAQAQYDRWLKELSNWGRWGTDDELGALNLITPGKRRAAAVSIAPTSTRSRRRPPRATGGSSC